MCGITGWVSYDPAHPVSPSVVAAMADTMTCRGPDAHGVWHDELAALGHRRLSVIDLDGGVQPMTVEHGGRTVAALTYGGEVFNYRELRAELSARGHAFRTDSDTEVVLRAFLEWGEDLTTRLNGMYAFAVWEPAVRELLLVRDRMGVKPLYYHPLPDGLLFGSEPKAILAHPAVRGVLDAEGMAELLAFTKTPGHAVYRGMYELRPGHTLRLTPTGARVRRYWALEAHEHTDDTLTTVRTVRELLDDTIARQLVSDVELCTLLSGGLDSSVITALAAEHLRSTGAGAVRSFALDFTGQAENFQADGWRGSPDTPFADLLARHVGAEHSVVTLDTAELMDPAHRAAVLRARDYPFDLGDGDTSLYLLFRAIREHSTVALSGESADELFGGYRWFHDADTVAAPTFPWLASPFAVGISGPASGRKEALLDRGLLAKLDLPGYQAQRYAEALAEVPYLDGVTGLERRMREQCYLHLTRFLPWMLDRKDRTSMAVGLEVRVPFCDHRLVDYVFNTPWSMKTFDGREKSLLRAATRDVLPVEIADRVKSPYPTTQDPRYLTALRTELTRLTSDPDAPVRALLDTAAVRAATAPDAGPGFRTSTELVIQLDTWLRTHDVALEL